MSPFTARLIPCLAVPFSVQLGLLCALLTALGSIVGFFLKHKGAVQAPPVEWRQAAPQLDRAVPLADLRDRLRRGHDVVGLPRRGARAGADLASSRR